VAESIEAELADVAGQVAYPSGSWYSTHLTTFPSKITSTTAFGQIPSRQVLNGGLEQSTLEGWNDIRH